MTYSWELVSFSICPYVQRSVITLLVKRFKNFKVTSIQLDNKPEWFLKISPFGKVPLLIKKNESSDKPAEVLFESAIINEFLDEVTQEPKLAPQVSAGASPSSAEFIDVYFLRATNKAWIEYCNASLHPDVFAVNFVKDEEEFQAKLDVVLKKFEYLENYTPEVLHLPYFNGKNLSLVDTAYAPLFQRLEHISQILGKSVLERFPKISQWSQNLLALKEVWLSLGITLELVSPSEAVDILEQSQEEKYKEIAEKVKVLLEQQYVTYWKNRNSWLYQKFSQKHGGSN